MKILTNEISNHPVFSDVLRKINFERFVIDGYSEQLDIFYSISHERGGMDISGNFNQNCPIWSISNATSMMIRDENFEPIPNPDFVYQEDLAGINNESERYLRSPAFSYVMNLIFEQNVPLKTILLMYLAEEDRDGRFNF